MILFRGEKKSQCSSYFYEESNLLFGKEVLAPHLIEYEESDEKNLIFQSEFFQKLCNEIKNDENEFISIADVRIRNNLNTDIMLCYEPNMFSKFSAEMIQSSLSEWAKFNVTSQIGYAYSVLVPDIDRSVARYLQIQISEDFVKSKSTSLSSHLQKSFNPDRYVDSQVATFLIMTSLSGSSTKS